MAYYVLADFGSTFTKAAVVSQEQERVIFSTQYPSTVNTDASIALEKCFADIEGVIGKAALGQAKISATSSAAGGLRMAVIGLTERLSLTAGKNVAFGAGAKIVGVSAGKMTSDKIERLQKIPLEMILFCGGYEKGARTTLIQNAKVLADSTITCPIIFGGNSEVSHEIRSILIQGNKECFVVPNIIPNVGELETRGCEEIIRELFMKRIINMKGLSKIQKIVKTIIPTPAAVLAAGNLLSKGTDNYAGYGNMMIVDVGGATTDIHSYLDNVPGEGAKLIGAPEPYAKRTVEGDLGMRESSDTLLAEAGYETVSTELKIDVEHLRESINARVNNHDFIAETDTEKQVDQQIAANAVRIAARRHCGEWKPIHSSNCSKIQVGKNLENIKLVIGTGGPVINSLNPQKILEGVLRQGKDRYLLLPRESAFLIDQDYILYAVGLLSEIDRDFAFKVMDNSLKSQQS